ncbi:hypothetical protein [Paenarthrobacter aurescens]|uniref:Uncharacterized protein n=1 Tax=Paenarthrobacter aurescens TaxID=43663 RepID=A0A4Y3NKG4_PAEAU|nr:hypothetical protein [Paenarthrobacter aurescens]MDO6142938.1 hypothetical protein [Paenarthrobacter aurescens]MDO6146783.1 hypothetical protein [Paenarthrobacter aurescens]MDO6158029.1 hypothetical protein [Paenarthrobacter aurescens]MDO6162014.1 hypothetical protein [Paenarthrobacter aurescens]GEB19471.1 hypothetical protein AAU01_22260 [Paenarthrobacter aurescens]
MRWILEEPGYEVDDRREEVLQECPPGRFLIGTTPQPLVALANCLYEASATAVDRARFADARNALRRVQEHAGPFWLENPHGSFSSQKPLMWRSVELQEKELIDLFDCYEEGWFPVTVDDGETDVFRAAISAVLRTIDNEELVSRIDATETQLRELVHHMK